MLGRSWLGIGLIAMGFGLAINSLLGPLLLGLVSYPVTPAMVSQTIGLDTVSLVLVAPLSVSAGVLALRAHPAAPALALGAGSYTAYMLAQYVVGPDYLYYPGALLLHLALFILGWSVSLAAWRRIPAESLAGDERRRRRLGLILLFLAGFILLRYLPALGGSVRQTPLPPDAQSDPAMFWTILLLDLGIVVPVAVAAGITLRANGSPWATKAGYATVGWFAQVGTAVATMGAVMLIRGDQYASALTTLVFALVALAAIAAAVWLYRPLFERPAG